MIAGKYVKPVRTPVTAYEAVNGFRKACWRMWRADKPETIAVLTAQSALESGRWAAMWNFNPSNIKHSDTREGLYTCIKLNEKLPREGKLTYVWFDPVLGELTSSKGPARYPDKPHELPPGHPQCRMRAFEFFADGLEDKLAFLNKPRWEPAKEAAKRGDPAVYVEACKKLGYFTADLAPYLRSVVSLFRTFLPMARKQALEPELLPPEQEEQLCVDMAECMRVEIPEWLKVKTAQIQALTAHESYEDLRDEMRRARDGR